MVQQSVDALVSISNELATALGRPPAEARTPPDDTGLPGDLVALLSCGALVLERQGVDLARIEEFTTRARQRGMRLNVLVFGWHPEGHTWLASPINHRGEAKVIEINRVERLATTELTLEQFVERTVEAARAAIQLTRVGPPEPSVPAESLRPLVPEKPEREGRRPRPPVKVELPRSAGARVVAHGASESLDGRELGYLVWCMRGLQLTSDDPPPDLSRWVSRALRASGLTAVPDPSDPGYPAYREAWARLTWRDRAATGSVSHQVPIHKFTVPGEWVLDPREIAVLRRSRQAVPPRHRPDEGQRATWERWMRLLESDSVEIHVR